MYLVRRELHMYQGLTDGTGRALVEFWRWAVSAGLVKPNTAKNFRVASEKVLEATPGWRDLDIRSADLDDVLLAFMQRGEGVYSSESLQTYTQRFRNAVRMYLDYLNA